MTKEQLHILQHSLGLDQYGRGKEYRNRYVVGPDCDSFTACQELVSMGMMQDRGAQPICGGMHCFMVTDWGRMKMHEESPEPPKVSRGRQRYLKWLEVGDAFGDWKFGDWLKAGGYKPEFMEEQKRKYSTYAS